MNKEGLRKYRKLETCITCEHSFVPIGAKKYEIGCYLFKDIMDVNGICGLWANAFGKKVGDRK